MLKRIGWLCCTLSTGLLLHILVQIRWLHWLPEFPGYPALATLAGFTALVATACAIVGSNWKARVGLAFFMPLVLTLSMLAASSASTAVENWRDIVLWPTLFAGVAACGALGAKWQSSVSAIWPLAGAVTTILAIWYAPSLGEAQSLRAYQNVLAASSVTVALALLLPLVELPRGARWSLGAILGLPPLVMALACVVQPEPDRIGTLLLAVAMTQFALLLFADYRWLSIDATTCAPNKFPPGEPRVGT